MAKILLIDDSEALLAEIQAMLAAAGHDVVATASGATALRHVTVAPVDLVLTDLYMPPPDGFEILQALRAAGSGVPVIVMSTNPLPCDVFRAARLLGARAALQKPFGADRLRQAIEVALAHRRGQRNAARAN